LMGCASARTKSMLSLVCESDGRERSHRPVRDALPICVGPWSGVAQPRFKPFGHTWSSYPGSCGWRSPQRERNRCCLSYARAKGENVLIGEKERTRGAVWIPGTALHSRDLSLLAILGPHIRVRADGVLLSENEIDVVSRMRERRAKTFA